MAEDLDAAYCAAVTTPFIKRPGQYEKLKKDGEKKRNDSQAKPEPEHPKICFGKFWYDKCTRTNCEFHGPDEKKNTDVYAKWAMKRLLSNNANNIPKYRKLYENYCLGKKDQKVSAMGKGNISIPIEDDEDEA